MKKDTFTIEEIHEIRSSNYEFSKHLSAEALIEKTKQSAASVWEKIGGYAEHTAISVASEPKAEYGNKL